MSEWIEQTIWVATENGAKEVVAEVCGPFAVHRPLNALLLTTDRTLTHVSSGRKLGDYFEYPDHAKAVAEALVQWPDADWTKRVPDLPRDAKQRYLDERGKVEGAP